MAPAAPPPVRPARPVSRPTNWITAARGPAHRPSWLLPIRPSRPTCRATAELTTSTTILTEWTECLARLTPHPPLELSVDSINNRRRRPLAATSLTLRPAVGTRASAHRSSIRRRPSLTTTTTTGRNPTTTTTISSSRSISPTVAVWWTIKSFRAEA